MLEVYETPMIPDREIDKAALRLLAGFNQQPVAQIHEILRRAEFWLEATTRFDAVSPSSEFQRAWKEFHGVSPKENHEPS